jgi:hypothetical protein
MSSYSSDLEQLQLLLLQLTTGLSGYDNQSTSGLGSNGNICQRRSNPLLTRCPDYAEHSNAAQQVIQGDFSGLLRSEFPALDEASPTATVTQFYDSVRQQACSAMHSNPLQSESATHIMLAGVAALLTFLQINLTG